MPSESLVEKLKLMTDRETKHQYDIGHYWNVCEEVMEHLQKIKQHYIDLLPKDHTLMNFQKKYENQTYALIDGFYQCKELFEKAIEGDK